MCKWGEMGTNPAHALLQHCCCVLATVAMGVGNVCAVRVRVRVRVRVKVRVATIAMGMCGLLSR